MAGGSGDGQPRRRTQGRGTGATVRRPGPGAAPGQGALPQLSVVGIAGIGKSRLAWEFEKYLDGAMALQGDRVDDAFRCLERSIALFEDAGDTHAGARVAARLGRAYWLRGDL